MSHEHNKRQFLKEHKAWNPRPARVKADIFQSHPFFDPEDKVQVKYEMLRARELEGAALSDTCSQFGFSRESYRHILEHFREEGVAGLFGHKRGRQGPVKATAPVRDFICSEHVRDNSLTAEELAQRCAQEFEIVISRRTVFRVLEEKDRDKKKR
jgi:transposase